MNKIKLLDVIDLLEDLPDERLRRCTVGTVVGQLAADPYEVEFSDNTGEAFAFCRHPR